MGIFDNHWRRRAEAAEASLADMRETLDGLELLLAERATLISITRNGRMNRWLFTRGPDLVSIETVGSWDDDIETWKRDLLEPRK